VTQKWDPREADARGSSYSLSGILAGFINSFTYVLPLPLVCLSVTQMVLMVNSKHSFYETMKYQCEAIQMTALRWGTEKKSAI